MYGAMIIRCDREHRRVHVSICVRACPVLGLVPTTFMRQKEKNSVVPKLSRSEWHEHPLPPFTLSLDI